MSLRPEPFGSELKAELLRPRGSSTCLKAELLRPKGAAEGKGKASPSKTMDTLKRYVLELSGVAWCARNIWQRLRNVR